MTLEMFKGCSMKNKKGEVFNPDLGGKKQFGFKKSVLDATP